MNFTEKTHTIKHFLRYAFCAKTKFRVHSPFVFDFILEVLEKKQVNSGFLQKELNKYYTNSISTANFNNNAGAGSIVLKKGSVKVPNYIKKTSLPEKYGALLENIITHYNCTKTLELGTSLGISTSYLASNSNNLVISVEANKDIYGITKEAFTKLKVSNISLINAYFDDVLLDICQQNKLFSLVFIDGDHTKKSTLKNFNILKPYLNENSIVILDDIYWSKEMTKAWHEIRQDLDVSLSIDLFRIGLLFFRVENYRKEHFTLWY